MLQAATALTASHFIKKKKKNIFIFFRSKKQLGHNAPASVFSQSSVGYYNCSMQGWFARVRQMSAPNQLVSGCYMGVFSIAVKKIKGSKI